MAVDSRAPTTELGRSTAAGFGPAPWHAFIDDHERVPELAWPLSVAMYDVMRTDSQITSLLRGTLWPIRRYDWRIDPNGARPEVVEKIASELNLPLLDEDPGPRRRTAKRFSHDNHLRHALLALTYGHMYFEQVGYIGEDDGLWHLRKLAPRMPQTIAEINLAEDGGLVSIKQNIGWPEPKELPVDRLVAYVWEQEGANWVGQSILRCIYKDWLIKDRLVRVDAINHERAGGVPVVEAAAGATPTEMAKLAQLAQQFKVGEASGGSIPAGTKLHLVSGGGSQAIDSVRYYDEQMARTFLLMFMQLGQTQTGSRALGETTMDFVSMSREVIADWYCDVTNEHVIEDYVDWNWGPGEEFCPLICYIKDEGDAGPQEPDPLLQEVDQNGLALDPELNAALRKPAHRPLARATGGRRRQRVERAATVEVSAPSSPLPARPLRRQPYAHELASAADFQSIDAHWVGQRDQMVAEWLTIRATQIDELHDQIVDANGSLKKLAKLEAPRIGVDTLEARMRAVAEVGITEAVAEAQRQNVMIARPAVDDVSKALRSRAEATVELLSQSISEAASRKAISLTGGTLTAADVANETTAYLLGLTNSWLEDHLGGVTTAAMNAGRKLAINRGPASRLYASELLDANTCQKCAAKDGTEYLTMSEAERDYPTGGYKDCQGGPRCRGTIVAVYGEAEPTLARKRRWWRLGR